MLEGSSLYTYWCCPQLLVEVSALRSGFATVSPKTWELSHPPVGSGYVAVLQWEVGRGPLGAPGRTRSHKAFHAEVLRTSGVRAGPGPGGAGRVKAAWGGRRAGGRLRAAGAAPEAAGEFQRSRGTGQGPGTPPGRAGGRAGRGAGERSPAAMERLGCRLHRLRDLRTTLLVAD